MKLSNLDNWSGIEHTFGTAEVFYICSKCGQRIPADEIAVIRPKHEAERETMLCNPFAEMEYQCHVCDDEEDA